MSSYQNRPWETTVYLSLSGSPVTGVLYSQLTVQYKKFAQTTLSTRTLLSTDWVELGNGYYTLVWESSFLDTLGPFIYFISGTGFSLVFGKYDVDPQPLVFSVPPGLCALTGNVRDIGGNPAIHRSVSVYAPEFPVIVGSSVVTGDKSYTTPDVLGNFSLSVLQGQVVIVDIEATGIRAQITIPMASSANLTDLLPPL